MEKQETSAVTPEEFIRIYPVASYEIGPGSVMKLSVLLRLCQETSERHLEALHLGYEELAEKGMAFLIITNRARIRRLPRHGEDIVIKTHPRGTAGVQFYRDFMVYQGEERIIEVMQTSVAADTHTHKPLRPKAFLDLGVFRDEKVEAGERVGKIALPEDMLAVGERPIYYSDLDQNRHLNNTIYGDILMDFLPPARQEAFAPREVQINYVNESTLGETLRVTRSDTAERTVLQGENGRGVGFTAAIRWME